MQRHKPEYLVQLAKRFDWKVVYRRAFPRRPGFTRDEAVAELSTPRGIILGAPVFCRSYNGHPRENWRAQLLVPDDDE